MGRHISKLLFAVSIGLFFLSESALIYRVWMREKEILPFFDPNIEALGLESSIYTWGQGAAGTPQLEILEDDEIPGQRLLSIAKKSGGGWSGVSKSIFKKNFLTARDTVVFQIRNNGPPLTFPVMFAEAETPANPIPENWQQVIHLESNIWQTINLPLSIFTLNRNYFPKGKPGNEQFDIPEVKEFLFVFPPDQDIHLSLDGIQFAQPLFLRILALGMILSLSWWCLLLYFFARDRMTITNRKFWPEWAKFCIYQAAIAVLLSAKANIDAVVFIMIFAVLESVFYLYERGSSAVKKYVSFSSPALVCLFIGFYNPRLLILPVLCAAHMIRISVWNDRRDAAAQFVYYALLLLFLRYGIDVGIDYPAAAAGVPLMAGYLGFALLQKKYDLIEDKQRSVQQFIEQHIQYSQRLEAISRLAGGAAHEFNNLLTGVIGNLTMIQNRNHQDITKYVENSLKAANRASELVKELLYFSRISKINREPAQINPIVTEIYELFRQNVRPGITITLNLSDGLPDVSVDSVRLKIVLMNILMNAKDAIEKTLAQNPSSPGHIHVETALESIDPQLAQINTDIKAGPHVVIAIQDDGIGISKDDLSRIFDPFYTTKEVGEGTGLSLASAFGIIKDHQGWIDVDSEPNQGARCRIHLPAA
ncbi:MAG: ATP-binding protein [Candidatus Omnitrophota bacterium]